VLFGVNTAFVPTLVTTPVTGVAATLLSASVKLVALIVAGIHGFAEGRGNCRVERHTAGRIQRNGRKHGRRVESVPAPVVKLHVLAAAIAWPAASVTAVEIVAVYTVLAVSGAGMVGVARLVGVKVAVLEAAS